jgi:hypothetical protein
MLDPVLSNFRLDFGDPFFPVELTGKYDNYLFNRNYPLKTLRGYFHETIQEFSTPGIDLNELVVNGFNNIGKLRPSGWGGSDDMPNVTQNRSYPGTSPDNEIINPLKLTVTFRNTVLNYMYCYEVFHKYYKRKREITDFYITAVMMDSAEVPMFRFKFSDAYVASVPGLTFSYTGAFNESKTFDCTFTFNGFDVDLIIPDMAVNNISLR